MSTPQLGVCYYPEHWPQSRWAEDAKGMREHGITLVRIGEFAWSRIEPRQDDFAWDWLDRAMGTLADAGLKLILGTPTACPPHWLIRACPDVLPVDEQGRPRQFGSRRHYSFSSTIYREASRRITRQLAERYGQHPAIVGWQLDNEYGCHDTTLCYSTGALLAFRVWLRERYGDIERLNSAWGNVFWSQEYASFDDVGLPLAVTETNPAHRLAFRRFSSDQVVAFSNEQAAILREHIPPHCFLTHNFMGNFTDFDHHAVMRQLDIASWDSYPLGFLDQAWFDAPTKALYRRRGHPDWAAFHHDLYRGVGDGRFAVMEQQPGAVNWATHNAQPEPGMVRLWSWEAIAHGAEFVSWFRWRQAPFAQEQMHAGLLLPDASPAPASAEVQQLHRELAGVPVDDTQAAAVALVFDYEACWMTDIQPQSSGHNTLVLAFEYYSALRSLGLDIDIVRPGADLSAYALIVLPCQPVIGSALAEQLAGSAAQLLIGPRAGSKTAEFSISEELPPGPLQQLIPLRVISVDAIRPGVRVDVGEYDSTWYVHGWLEAIDSTLEPELSCVDGRGLLFHHGRSRYLAGRTSRELLTHVAAGAARDARLAATALPGGLRLRRRGELTYAFNYDPEAHALPTNAKLLLGNSPLEPGGVAVWRG